ncbi:cobalamin biosynthesis protein [Pseudomonas sp. HR96]|uniref:cobalamin biosynthesis protein n=1 Tax=Pseudomonas sp. HR96 TaxID=1027966 RepID=UPI002A762423|nr:cobalamin biosynthesis protein [Pseudomonas sp. HR96]WPO97911.1 cobalamin biosynthesis protein [Pseudomonas sp. HR96]
MPCPPAPRLFLGLGCRRGCAAEHVAALLDQVLVAHGLQREQIAGLASIDLKAGEPGLLALAGQLGLALQLYPAARLLACSARLSQRSARVFAASGCYGVAESAALTLADALGPPPSRLLVTRQTSAMASLAIAITR